MVCREIEMTDLEQEKQMLAIIYTKYRDYIIYYIRRETIITWLDITTKT
jgi:hypothetical protein